MNLVQFAQWLNERDWPTRRGGKWTATQVDRVFKRLGLKKAKRRRAAPRPTSGGGSASRSRAGGEAGV
ncbi:TPA: recombinase family protein [Stenotrophomonas maltophilia]|uniref:recombinase family protein n=1 Tax=Stenotrophomonas maltophilia TaxID=40324 RepID=UPI0038CB3888